MGDRAVDGTAAVKARDTEAERRARASQAMNHDTELLLQRIQCLEEELYTERCEKNQWLLSFEKQIEHHNEAERAFAVKIDSPSKN